MSRFDLTGPLVGGSQFKDHWAPSLCDINSSRCQVFQWPGRERDRISCTDRL